MARGGAASMGRAIVALPSPTGKALVSVPIVAPAPQPSNAVQNWGCTACSEDTGSTVQTLCPACRARMTCPQCGAPLTYIKRLDGYGCEPCLDKRQHGGGQSPTPPGPMFAGRLSFADSNRYKARPQLAIPESGNVLALGMQGEPPEPPSLPLPGFDEAAPPRTPPRSPASQSRPRASRPAQGRRGVSRRSAVRTGCTPVLQGKGRSNNP
jgi:hypothetical protein